MASSLTTGSVVVQSQSALVGSIHDQVVALNIDTGTCLGLNPVCSEIWRRIAEPSTVADVCLDLMDRYDVTPAECEAQVLEVLEGLRDEGVIEVR